MRAGRGIEPDVYITHPSTGGCSDLVNAVYELLLQMIPRYFAFGHETPEQRQRLANAADGLHPPEQREVTAAVSGTLSRTASNLMVHVEAV